MNNSNLTNDINIFLKKSTIIFLNSKSASIKILKFIASSKITKKYKYLDPNNLVKMKNSNKNNVFKKFI